MTMMKSTTTSKHGTTPSSINNKQARHHTPASDHHTKPQSERTNIIIEGHRAVRGASCSVEVPEPRNPLLELLVGRDRLGQWNQCPQTQRGMAAVPRCVHHGSVAAQM